MKTKRKGVIVGAFLATVTIFASHNSLAETAPSEVPYYCPLPIKDYYSRAPTYVFPVAYHDTDAGEKYAIVRLEGEEYRLDYDTELSEAGLSNLYTDGAYTLIQDIEKDANIRFAPIILSLPGSTLSTVIDGETLLVRDIVHNNKCSASIAPPPHSPPLPPPSTSS